MKMMRTLLWGLAVAGIFISNRASAAIPDFATPVKQNDTQYQTPDDLINVIPFISGIPRTFLLGDGYKFKLSGKELRIDHMGYQSHDPASKRTCTLGLSYTTPVAGFFASRVDLPLFHSDDLKLTDWSRSSFGDYIVFLSRNGFDQPASLRLALTARF